ncbi:MAG: NHLP bacteriocin export ABC transporter permease/ATPase subunit, partial [Cyanobacteriota bacterium]
IVVSLAIGGTLLGMLTPQATAILMDTAIPDSNRSLLLQLGMGLLAAALGSAIFELSQGILVTRLETGTENDMQTGLWDRLLTLPTAFFRRYSIGDLVGRVSAVQQIRQQIGATTMRSILSSIFALLNLALLFTYSVTLTWVALGVALVSILVTTASGILLLRQNQPLLELSGELNGLMVQLIDGVSKLRVAGAEQRAFAHWAKGYQEQVRRTVNIQLIEGAVQTVNQLIPTVTSVLLFWFAVGLIQRAQAQGGVGLTAGTFLAFNSAFGTFMGGMTDLSNTITTSLDVVQLWRRAKVILEEKPEVDPSKADPGRLSGGILLDHITFRYREDGPLTLEDLTVRADPGEFIALVGPSGSGKSTVFRLLLGFDMPLSGTVYFDGQDLAGLDVAAVRKQIGVVLQNSRIMSGSIFDNIAAGALVTLDEAWEAARMAGFAEDVESMPMGMHTVISEGGGNLSGGQRQRLIIARALVLRPKILLFDEATSALDNRTQAIVSASVDRLRATRIVIAHRLSTIRNADRIYVIEAGRVVQQGSFDKLSKEPGLFAELMARQTA